MAVHIQWDNSEKTVLRYDFEGRWTWQEFMAIFPQAKTMASTVQHTVHSIVNPLDDKSRGYLPPNTLAQVVQLYRGAPPNIGATVIVGGSEFFRTLNRLSRRFYPRIAERYQFADTLEEARSILRKEIDQKSA